MQIIREPHIFTGMQKDHSNETHPSAMLYDAKNIRLTDRQNNTLLCISNEKGTVPTNCSYKGVYIGSAQLNEYLIIFSVATTNMTGNVGYITLFNLDDSTVDGGISAKLLYQGTDIDFDIEHPVTAIVDYENENIQKVYWIDGKNQPRLLNIKDQIFDNGPLSSCEYFNFFPTLTLKETITVEKEYGSGSFAAGVIQYAFTYYNKYLQETNIVDVTPLQYITFPDRGGSPEDVLSCSFKIEIKNIQNDLFSYIRVYSIQRTSLEGTPIARIVGDINIKDADNTVTIVDNGIIGENVDVTSLLYKNNEVIIPKTMNAKDGTLFFGNYSYNRIPLVKDSIDKSQITVSSATRKIKCNPYNINGFTLSASSPAGFKVGEWYRLGLQFQHKTGKWSEVIYLKDYQIPRTANTLKNDADGVNVPTINVTISKTLTSDLKANGYLRCRLLYAQKHSGNRNIKAQGIVCPTVQFIKNDLEHLWEKGKGDNANADKYKSNTRWSSWFIRPLHEDIRERMKIGSAWRYSDKVKNYTKPTTRIPYANNTLYNYSSAYSMYYRPYEWLYRTSNNTVSIKNPAGEESPITEYPIKQVYLFDTGLALRSSTNFHDEHKPDTFWSPYPAEFDNIEIQNVRDKDKQLSLDWYHVTFHSPDLEFAPENFLSWNNPTDEKCHEIGKCEFNDWESDKSHTYSLLKIQLDSSPAKPYLNSRVEIKSDNNGAAGLISGFYYEDYAMDDSDGPKIEIWDKQQKKPLKWLIFPWQRRGSLNNDVARGNSIDGTASAVLKTKVLSNWRISGSNEWNDGLPETATHTHDTIKDSDCTIVNFTENQVVMKKIGDIQYYGNIDNMLADTSDEPIYQNAPYALGSDVFENRNTSDNVIYSVTSMNDLHWRFLKHNYYDMSLNQAATQGAFSEKGADHQFGDKVEQVRSTVGAIPIKYKSSPHLFMKWDEGPLYKDSYGNYCHIPIVEIGTYESKLGAADEFNLKQEVWIPCSDSIKLGNTPHYIYVNNQASMGGWETKVTGKYGDTFYQRYECLKTYPFTFEDENQVIEVVSFWVESYVNLDGRYDKNKGNHSNTALYSENFNLCNMVYSQTNNFFSYKIVDEDIVKNQNFPTQITWSLEKHPVAEIDNWSNFTQASTYNADGSLGEIQKIAKFNNNLYCFQNRGISAIKFNSRVQIPVSDGVPIEISNNYKCDGFEYITQDTGCIQPQTIIETATGLYFIDSINNHLYNISSKLTDVSISCKMASWFEDNGSEISCLTYDPHFNDIYLLSPKENEEVLCYSENLAQFTSFFDYWGIDYIYAYKNTVFALYDKELFKLFEGDYNDLFGKYEYVRHGFIQRLEYVPRLKPWHFSFKSTGSDASAAGLDKIFTNLEYRMDMFDDASYDFKNSLDFIQVENEYQNTGKQNLIRLLDKDNYKSYHNKDANLQKKFRIWRIQVPRNYNSMDRIRNPWTLFTLGNEELNTKKAILYDIISQFMV